MTTLTTANREWATRPDDQRFVSLFDLYQHFDDIRRRSQTAVIGSRALSVEPIDDWNLTITMRGKDKGMNPTNWSFGQLAGLASAPAGFLSTLPAPLVADCINYSLHYRRDVEDVKVLQTGETLRSITGPQYGRIWNGEIADHLFHKFGDGRTGQWRVPGIFGEPVEVSKENTTIFGSDRDMFVFLADEERRIELPNRRGNQTGSLARGFFVWNSEVGSRSIGAAFFLFDYVCANRLVWGAEGYREIRLKHSAGAPDRWLSSITPVLREYSEASALPVQETLRAAQAHKLDDVSEFLRTRFSKGLASQIESAFEVDEGRPIKSLYDAVNGVTALARGITHQDKRVALEQKAGELLALAA